MTLTPDAYLALLEERRDAWTAEHGTTRYPPLLEWFIRDGDEDLVDMAAIDEANRAEQPTPTRRPRRYLPASHHRAELARIDAHLAALDPGPRHGTTDPAAYGGIGIRQTPRQQRAWGERIDRTAAEYVRLTRRRAEVVGRLARAEEREAKTAATELANSGLTCDNGGVLADKRTAPAGALTPVDSGASPLDRSD